jgi:NADH dehydrogenase FAD-containing subunit
VIQRPPHLVIGGGGIAAAEALRTLRANAGERVEITLTARDRHVVLPPLAVAQAFGGAPVHRDGTATPHSQAHAEATGS